MTTTQQAYINGFVKRATESGYTAAEGLELLKYARSLEEHRDNLDEKTRELHRRTMKKFYYWKHKLRNKGVFAGTYHKRVAIPKTSLKEDDLKALGFEPSLIAIPESGQDRFASFRHPENLLHLHSHNDHWTMHEDEHPSLSMALRGASLREMPGAVASGLSHVLTEGVPGAYKYIANRIGGGGGMLDAVVREARMGGVKQANHNDAPTLKQINDYYKGIVHALNENAVEAKKVAKKDIVKDVPIVSGYGELVDEAKKQKIGLIKRHLLAMVTRPAVWSKSNALFLPYGKHGLVVSSDKINEDVIKHELGHAEDYARLGGHKGFNKEYHPGFFERMRMSDREYLNRSLLLPEARAWHYAGRPVPLDPNNPDKLRDRAFGSYVNYVDQMALN